MHHSATASRQNPAAVFGAMPTAAGREGVLLMLIPQWTAVEWITVLAAAGTCVTAFISQFFLLVRGLREMRGRLDGIHHETNSQLPELREELRQSGLLLQQALGQVARMEERLRHLSEPGTPQPQGEEGR